MGKITVSEFVSLDGVMEGPGGEADYKHRGWVMKFPDDVQYQYKLKEVLDHEALLIGRKTYDGFAAAWPARNMGAFSDKMNGMPKFVASTTLKRPEWNNSTVLKGDTAEAVANVKQQVKGDILVAGSRTLVNFIKQHGLVDEYRMMVFPIILGSGMRLFDNTDDARSLQLVDMQRLSSGTVILTYHPAKAA